MSATLWGCLAVSVLCVTGCGERPLTPREPTQGVFHFKIATYNVYDHKATDPATIDAIGQLDAEIIALQEVTPAAEPVIRERYKERYPNMLFYPSGSAGLGFLSSYPITDRGLTPGVNGWHPAWHVWVGTPAGALEVLVVHLRAPQGRGLENLQSIAATPDDHRTEIATYSGKNTGDMPVVVLGDFNEGVDGAAVEYLEARGFQNALPLYRPGQFTWRHKSVGGQFTQTIDHILFDGHMASLNAYVRTIGASDHLPVIAHLEVARPWKHVAQSPLVRDAERGVQAPVVVSEVLPAGLDLAADGKPVPHPYAETDGSAER